MVAWGMGFIQGIVGGKLEIDCIVSYRGINSFCFCKLSRFVRAVTTQDVLRLKIVDNQPIQTCFFFDYQGNYLCFSP